MGSSSSSSALLFGSSASYGASRSSGSYKSSGSSGAARSSNSSGSFKPFKSSDYSIGSSAPQSSKIIESSALSYLTQQNIQQQETRTQLPGQNNYQSNDCENPYLNYDVLTIYIKERTQENVVGKIFQIGHAYAILEVKLINDIQYIQYEYGDDMISISIQSEQAIYQGKTIKDVKVKKGVKLQDVSKASNQFANETEYNLAFHNCYHYVMELQMLFQKEQEKPIEILALLTNNIPTPLMKIMPINPLSIQLFATMLK